MMKHPVKPCVYLSAVLLLLLFLLPLFTVSVIRREQEEQDPEATEILPPGEIDSAETIRVLLGGTVETMSMSRYLQGVVRAEMPASFEQEALCAQAVAARTYTLYKIASGSNHGAAADVCGDSTCCQAYLDQKTAEKNWGKKAAAYEAKIENAVSMTDGQTILYQGKPILAVFHSSSAGRTKSSGEVWSQDLPYLQSVTSPEQGSKIPNYYSRVEFSADDFRQKFLKAYPNADFSGDVSTWVTGLSVTEGTNVDKVTIGKVSVRGSQVRSIFSLRSASFELEAQGSKLVFYVTGFGHGVGMSQYGANAMAQSGADWKEIVEHYYTGVTVASWTRSGAG